MYVVLRTEIRVRSRLLLTLSPVNGAEFSFRFMMLKIAFICSVGTIPHCARVLEGMIPTEKNTFWRSRVQDRPKVYFLKDFF